MEGTISIPRSSRKGREFPAPDQGIYGPGLQIEADTFLWEVKESEWNPGYDKEGEFAPYWQFSFKIVTAEGPTYFVRDLQSFKPGSGSKASLWLEAAGAPFETYTDDDGEECDRFDLQQAAPRKVGGIEMGPKWVGRSKDDPEREITRHGKIIRVIE